MDSVDNLKYQRTLPLPAQQGNELMTVKLRYKEPQGGKSRLLSRTVQDTGTPLQRTSSGFRFAAAVAEFGLLLRQSDFRGQANYGSVLELAGQALSDDPEGYRHAFIDLVKNAQQLTHDGPENTPETENSAFIPRNHIFPLSIKEIKP